MRSLPVNTIVFRQPLSVYGKFYRGDYGNSSNNEVALINELRSMNVVLIPNKVLGVYFDNPKVKIASELLSFQGVFLEAEAIEVPESFTKLTMEGKYLYTKVKGKSRYAINEGYFALLTCVLKNGIQLKSATGYQMSTCEEGNWITEIFLEMS